MKTKLNPLMWSKNSVPMAIQIDGSSELAYYVKRVDSLIIFRHAGKYFGMNMKTILATIGLAVLLLAACGVSPRNPDDILKAFRTAGLEAVNPTLMSREDYGIAPLLCQSGARHFFLPSLGDTKGGRIFVCENVSDANKLKAYYDELGKASAIFSSWTYQNGATLVQLNGDLSQTQAARYGKVIADLP